MIESLIDRPKRATPERDYLDVLSDLVEAYESEAVPMRAVGRTKGTFWFFADH